MRGPDPAQPHHGQTGPSTGLRTGIRANGQSGTSGRILHVDFVALAEAATDEDRGRLIEEARKLSALDGVLRVSIIEGEAGSDFDLAFLFLLPDFAALEPFGTDPSYSRFLQGYVAPVLRGFAGADVRAESDFPAAGPHCSCLAIEAPEETYDWEVSAALREWIEDVTPSSAVVGLAVGERQRYRGVALAWADAQMSSARPDDPRFKVTSISGRTRELS